MLTEILFCCVEVLHNAWFSPKSISRYTTWKQSLWAKIYRKWPSHSTAEERVFDLPCTSIPEPDVVDHPKLRWNILLQLHVGVPSYNLFSTQEQWVPWSPPHPPHSPTSHSASPPPRPDWSRRRPRQRDWNRSSVCFILHPRTLRRISLCWKFFALLSSAHRNFLDAINLVSLIKLLLSRDSSKLLTSLCSKSESFLYAHA